MVNIFVGFEFKSCVIITVLPCIVNIGNNLAILYNGFSNYLAILIGSINAVYYGVVFTIFSLVISTLKTSRKKS